MWNVVEGLTVTFLYCELTAFPDRIVAIIFQKRIVILDAGSLESRYVIKSISNYENKIYIIIYYCL